jgi:hypothetical protein
MGKELETDWILAVNDYRTRDRAFCGLVVPLRSLCKLYDMKLVETTINT